MTVHIVLKTYRATQTYNAYTVVLGVFDSAGKAQGYGETYVDIVPGFDTDYDINIFVRDVK